MKLNIILWPYQKSDKWYHTLVSRLICFFTNSNYTHAAIGIGKTLYESTVMSHKNGALKSVGFPPKSRNCVYLEFKLPLPDKEIKQIKALLEQKVVEKRPYNFMKIAVLTFVYPTRRFWRWLNWVPFQNEVFGSVCSVFVDENFKQIGIDLLPGENEEYTAPGDFLKSKLLTSVSNA